MSVDVNIGLPGVNVGVNVGGSGSSGGTGNTGGSSNSNSGDWPCMPGNSKADDSMAYYNANGFTKGSIADRERARLLALVAEPSTAKKSIFDLYKQLNVSNSGKRVR